MFDRTTDFAFLAAGYQAGVGIVSVGVGAGYWWYRGNRRGGMA